jgi:hypothetical protein
MELAPLWKGGLSRLSSALVRQTILFHCDSSPFDALRRGQELRGGDGGRVMLVILWDNVPDELRNACWNYILGHRASISEGRTEHEGSAI